MNFDNPGIELRPDHHPNYHLKRECCRGLMEVEPKPAIIPRTCNRRVHKSSTSFYAAL